MVAQEQEKDPGSGRAEVSILVVNFNGARVLAPCLESLANVTGIEIEVIVVDNGSTDGSAELARRSSGVTVVQSDRNRGFAGGNNFGLPHCSGKYVLLLNNDTVVPPDFLQPLYACLEQNPGVGVVQGKMLLPNFSNTLDVCGSFLTWFGLPYHYGYLKPDGPKYQKSYPVFSGKGACLMFRKKLIDQVGGYLFDEDFFCYYEESDFCHRSWLAGWEVRFVPGPPVQHLMGSTAGGPHSTFVLTHYLRNMMVSLASNLSLVSRLRILPVFWMVLFAGLIVALLTFRGGTASAHAGALLAFFTRYGKIRRRRAQLKQFRRRSDRWVFEKVLVTPRLEYFLKTMTGRIGTYQDEEL